MDTTQVFAKHDRPFVMRRRDAVAPPVERRLRLSDLPAELAPVEDELLRLHTELALVRSERDRLLDMVDDLQGSVEKLSLAIAEMDGRIVTQGRVAPQRASSAPAQSRGGRPWWAFWRG